jgi:hypothetical protein
VGGSILSWWSHFQQKGWSRFDRPTYFFKPLDLGRKNDF